MTAGERIAWLFGATTAMFVGGFGSYEVWPTGILDVPFSALTLGKLLQALGSVGLGFIAIIGIGAIQVPFRE